MLAKAIMELPGYPSLQREVSSFKNGFKIIDADGRDCLKPWTQNLSKCTIIMNIYNKVAQENCEYVID